MATTKVNVSKISDFPKVTPAGTDQILVEKDGQGGSITLSQIPVSTPVSTRIAGEVNTLNSRIDNIVASSGDDISEIVDARQGSDGTNYASLRARLDAENNQLKGDLDNIKPNVRKNTTFIKTIDDCFNVIQNQPFTTKEVIESIVSGSSYNNYPLALNSKVVTKEGFVTVYVKTSNNNSIKVAIVEFDGNSHAKIKQVEEITLNGTETEVTTNLYANIGDYIAIIYNQNALYSTHYLLDFSYWKGVVFDNVVDDFEIDGFTQEGNVSFLFDYSISTRVINQNIDSKNTSIIGSLYNAENLNIKLLGDSITHGVGGTGCRFDGDDIVTEGDTTWKRNPNGYCWANLFKKMIESKFNCTVTNNACTGTGSKFIVDNISSLISDSDDIVICMIGTNNRGTIYDRLYSDLYIIKNYCEERNIKLILMSSIPTGLTDEETRTYHMEDINNTINAFTEINGIAYINLFNDFYMYCMAKGITVDSLLNANDHLHPNDDGYYLMYRLICKRLGLTAPIQEATW